jgi:hypothetical protein
MSFVRWGLAAVVAASLHSAVARAADTQGGNAGMKHDSGSQDASTGMKQDSGKMGAGHVGAMERTATGEVKGIDSKALTFANGEQFRLSNDTVFNKDGQKVSQQDIKAGDQVKATYEARNKLAYATQIEVTSGGAVGASAGQQGTGSAAGGAATQDKSSEATQDTSKGATEGTGMGTQDTQGGMKDGSQHGSGTMKDSSQGSGGMKDDSQASPKTQ